MPVSLDSETLSEDAKTLVELGFSKSFCKVLSYVYKNACTLVNFDRDAETIEDLRYI